MGARLYALDLVIGAMAQLNPVTGERQNVVAFIESCYGGRVRGYDLGAASASLKRLSEEEQVALIEWVLQRAADAEA